MQLIYKENDFDDWETENISKPFPPTQASKKTRKRRRSSLHHAGRALSVSTPNSSRRLSATSLIGKENRDTEFPQNVLGISNVATVLTPTDTPQKVFSLTTPSSSSSSASTSSKRYTRTLISKNLYKSNSFAAKGPIFVDKTCFRHDSPCSSSPSHSLKVSKVSPAQSSPRKVSLRKRIERETDIKIEDSQMGCKRIFMSSPTAFSASDDLDQHMSDDELEDYHSPYDGLNASSSDLGSESEEEMVEENQIQNDERIGDVVARKLQSLLTAIIGQDNGDAIFFENSSSMELSSDAFTYSSSVTEGSRLFESIPDGEYGLLLSATIERIYKLVQKAILHDRLGDIDENDFARVIKILERSVKEAQHCGIFDMAKESDYNMEDADNDSSLDFIKRRFAIIRNASRAVVCICSILAGGRWSKHFYNEETLTYSLDMLKTQLQKSIYATFVANENQNTLLERYFTADTEACKRSCGKLLLELNNSMASIRELFCLNGMKFPDNVVIQAAYVSLAPFFVDTSMGLGRKLFGNGTIDGINVEALSLIKTIFARNPDQRQWILDEVMTSLINLPVNKASSRQYKLANGKSIHMITAILLVLIQSCAEVDDFDIPDVVESLTEAKLDQLHVDWKGILDKASSNAAFVVNYLISRSLKASKNSFTEAEYRVVFDRFIADLLTTLSQPEWPAAELFLRICSRNLISFIDDQSKQDNSKILMATEILGHIAVQIQIQKMYIKSLDRDTKLGNDAIITSLVAQDGLGLTTKESVRVVLHAMMTILAYLDDKAQSDPILKASRSYLVCQWGTLWCDAVRGVQPSSQPEDNELDPTSQEVVCGQDNVKDRIHQCIHRFHKLMKLPLINDDDPSSGDLAMNLMMILGQRQLLARSFEAIISRLLFILDRDSIMQRSKALKALSGIATANAEVLMRMNVNEIVARRLTDVSSSVRDSAVEFVGSHMLADPGVCHHYYKPVSERILDRGINVRKRVVRLLKELYGRMEDDSNLHLRSDIICKLLFRTEDEEGSVRELATKSLQELLIIPTAGIDSLSNGEGIKSAKKIYSCIENCAETIIGVCGGPISQMEVLTRFFKKCSQKSDGKKVCKAILDTKFLSLLMDYLNEALIKEALSSAKRVMDLLRAVSCLCLVHPPLMNASRAAQLLPYLKGCSTPQDRLMSCEVLMIYRNCLPHIKLPGIEFCETLQTLLSGLLNRPDPLIIREAVPCLVVLVDKHTKNFDKLVNLLRSLFQQLASEREKFNEGKEINARNIIMFLLLLGLLCKNFDFAERRSQVGKKLWNKISQVIGKKKTVNMYAFEVLRYFATTDYHAECGKSIKRQAWESLGWIFQVCPSLLTKTQSIEDVSTALEFGDSDLVNQIFLLFKDFLAYEQTRSGASKQVKEVQERVDMKQLVGNSEEFADAGVAGSTMQRFLPHILQYAVGVNVATRFVSLMVIEQVVVNGLAHPLLVMPSVVALSGRTDFPEIRKLALSILKDLNMKYSTLIHTRFVECATAAATLYIQDVDLFGGPPKLEEGAFNQWYNVIATKRNRRNDFIKNLITSMDVNERDIKHDDFHTRYAAFVVDNIARLIFRSHEEVFLIIFYCNRIIATTGATVLQKLESEMKEMEEHSPQRSLRSSVSSAISLFDQISDQGSSRATSFDLGEEVQLICEAESETIGLRGISNDALVISMLLKLKEYLKITYGLTEAKCISFNPTKARAIEKEKATNKVNENAELPTSNLSFVWEVKLTRGQIEQRCKEFLSLMDQASILMNDSSDEVEEHSKRKRKPVGDKQAGAVTQRRTSRITAGKRKRDKYFEEEGRGIDDDQESSSNAKDSEFSD